MKGEQILNAAKNLFTNYGFKKVSMDEIASEAKVKKKTVYTYLNVRNRLHSNLIQHYYQQKKCFRQHIRSLINKLFLLYQYYQIQYYQILVHYDS
mgnify:CR=1 FL=1